MEYDNRNRGVLFKNGRKEKETDADYSGTYTNIDGEEHWLDAYLAKDRNGKTYMRIKTKLKSEAHKQGMEKAREALEPQPAPQPEGFPEDDIPF